jgi:hypothetical protein
LEIQKYSKNNTESNQVRSLQKETPQVFACNLFENFESISEHIEICTKKYGFEIPLKAILLGQIIMMLMMHKSNPN